MSNHYGVQNFIFFISLIRNLKWPPFLIPLLSGESSGDTMKLFCCSQLTAICWFHYEVIMTVDFWQVPKLCKNEDIWWIFTKQRSWRLHSRVANWQSPESHQMTSFWRHLIRVTMQLPCWFLSVVTEWRSPKSPNVTNKICHKNVTYIISHWYL